MKSSQDCAENSRNSKSLSTNHFPVPSPLIPYFHINISPNSWLICCCLVTKSCPTLCDPMDCSTPGFPVLYHLLEFAQIDVHWVGDAIQPSHLLSSPFPPALHLSYSIKVFSNDVPLHLRWPKYWINQLGRQIWALLPAWLPYNRNFFSLQKSWC